jgi:hypothetical protein
MDQTTKKAELDSEETSTLEDRREVTRKLGKLAAYAAPFTVLAFTARANTGSGHGPAVPRH